MSTAHLTRLRLPVRAIPDAHRLHTLTMLGFPDTGAGSAARADHGVIFQVVGERDIMVQSSTEPDRTRWEAHGIEVAGTQVGPLEAGAEYAIRTCVNATRTAGGKRIGIHDDAEAEEWVRRRLEVAGFEIHDLRVDAERSLTSRIKRGMRLAVRDVQAIVTVADADAAEDARARGIGRAAAYGCGMILARPV